MAVDYIKVLNGLEMGVTVIGRGVKSAKACREATGCDVVAGGLHSFLDTKPIVPTHAIVAVGVEKLAETTQQLLDFGVANILVEKPGGLNKQELEDVYQKSLKKQANVYVAYNRRFYSSVLKALDILAKDGGVTSFSFEFTEWSHVIEKLQKAEGVKENWFVGNSTHVADLAFYLGGAPREMCTFTAGSLDWHPAASIFSGAGISESGALFCYQANWESAGRWSVEMLTKYHRLILRPLEKLQIQKKGSVQIDFVECNTVLDESYKPGLFVQTKKFIDNLNEGLCSIKSHVDMMDNYYKMANYDLPPKNRLPRVT